MFRLPQLSVKRAFSDHTYATKLIRRGSSKLFDLPDDLHVLLQNRGIGNDVPDSHRGKLHGIWPHVQVLQDKRDKTPFWPKSVVILITVKADGLF